ncbi:hypothetical protein CAPTEDRAFT_107686 [Capitella teleta]|uniref:GOLD domain-containing protein n=1 Tax=Capitella teleta TaxID=283909 RepID=R7UGE2_CAPTE|nr:hypothetical protein CAPTEDRAFT_107686 [Capitella teleta]|eukprot:ELU05584.1 hypothetical protein CAPTEDRAFT_107686 [Capitella teleta]
MHEIKLLSSLALFFCLHSVSGNIEYDLTIDVNPGARECFFQKLKTGADCEVEYQVIDGGDLDVNFVIQAPSGRIILTEVRKMEGVHSFDVDETGDHQFCIDNTFSRFSNKVVFFELVADSDEETKPDLGTAIPDEEKYDIKLDDIKTSLDKVMERLKKSSSTQNVLRVLESRDRSVQENNFDRVNTWSCIQIFVLVSVALTHVLMIRGLFEDRSTTRHTKIAT